MGSWVRADPTDQAADVPHRLGQAVHRVERVEAEQFVAAHPTLLAASVQRHRRPDEVQAEVVVEVPDVERGEVHERVAHPEPVDAHHPGSGPVVVAQHPRTGPTVGLEVEEPVATRLVVAGRELAGPFEPLVGLAMCPAPMDPRVEQRWRIAVIGAGVVEPALGLEQPDRVGHLDPDALVLRAGAGSGRGPSPG